MSFKIYRRAQVPSSFYSCDSYAVFEPHGGGRHTWSVLPERGSGFNTAEGAERMARGSGIADFGIRWTPTTGRAYKITIVVCDPLGELGPPAALEELRASIGDGAHVLAIEARELAWRDDHPMNKAAGFDDVARELFDNPESKR
jgi:hypothetical protein